MDKNALIQALRNGAQSASNAVASNVSGPVDLLAAGLRNFGVPVENPMLGSQWMQQRGLTAPVEPGMSALIGESIGLAGPVAAVAKAPQIAASLNKGIDNLSKPKKLNSQSGVLDISGSKAVSKLGDVDTSYRIAHTAPIRDGSNTVDNMADIFPDDIYDPRVSWQYYGHGDKKLDQGTARIIANLKGKPDAEVTIYRAVPKGVKEINPGDWVTVNKDYASMHGNSWVNDGNYEIITKKVKARDIATDGNSIHEFGYSPLGAK